MRGDQAMTTQHKALQVPLYELLEAVPKDTRIGVHDSDEWNAGTTWHPVGAMCHQAAAELRRLQEVNTELVEALKELLFEEETQDNGLTEAVIMSNDEFVKFMRESVRSYESAKEKARKAIANATGENNG
jgi:uncharacterized UPF0160 family protein